MQVDAKAIEDFYKTAVLPRAKARGQEPPSLEASRDIIQEALVQQSIDAQADRWLKESRLAHSCPAHCRGMTHHDRSNAAPGNSVGYAMWHGSGGSKRFSCGPCASFSSLEWGLGNPLLRRRLGCGACKLFTGGRVELRTISVSWLSLRATLKGLEIHGLEPAGTEPLFASEEVKAGLRIDSFWGRKISLDDLYVLQPHLHIRVEKNGVSNVPIPRRPPSAKPLGQTLLDLHVRHVKFENGWILYNQVKAPLAIEGDNLNLAVDAGGPLDNLVYDGNLDWQNVKYTSAKFFASTHRSFRKVLAFARRLHAGARGSQRRPFPSSTLKPSSLISPTPTGT